MVAEGEEELERRSGGDLEEEVLLGYNVVLRDRRSPLESRRLRAATTT
jgi:hypothetical protein